MQATRPLSRRQFNTATALGLASVALGASGAAWAQGKNEPALPTIGSALHVPALSLLDGTQFEPAQGQPLLLYWWASWCPFCAVQSPHIESLWRKHRARGLQVLALSIDVRQQAAADYMRKKAYTFPAAMLTPARAKLLPKPKGLPVTVLRGRGGTVLFAEGGEMFPEDIEGLAKFL